MRRASLLLVFLLSACATAPMRLSEAVLADRLYCGLTIPDGGEIPEAEWRAFVRDEVTPRFPNGFSMWRAEGQWRERDGEIVSEPVLVIEIVHRHDLRIDEDIFEIAEAYKNRFKQEAVLRVTMPARMEFID